MKKQIRTEIIINAGSDRVWQVLTNFSGYTIWNPFIIESLGKAVAGTRLKNTMLNNGKKMVFKPVITRCEPNTCFEWLGSLWVKGLFDGRHSFQIEPISAQQVKLIQSEEFSGLLSGPILNKIGNDTRNNFIKMNQALKQVAEQG